MKPPFNPDIFLAAAELREAGYFSEFTCNCIRALAFIKSFENFEPFDVDATEANKAVEAYEFLYVDETVDETELEFTTQIYASHDRPHHLGETVEIHNHRIFMLLFAREFFSS